MSLRKALVLSIYQVFSQNFIINDEILIEKAKKFWKELKALESFKFLSGWLYRFKQSNNVKLPNTHGESASADPQDIDEAYKD